MMSDTIERKAAYSLNELAEATSMSVAFYRKEIQGGRLRAKLIGRRVVVLSEDAAAYLDSSPDWTPGRYQGSRAVAA